MVDHVVLWFLTSIFSLSVLASPFAKVFFCGKKADRKFGFYWFNDLLAGPWVLAQSLWLVETWKIRKIRLQEKPEELHNMSPLFRNTSNKICKTHLCSCSSGMNLGPQSRNTLAKNMRHAESCWQKDVPFAGQQFSWDRCMFESSWNSGLCFFSQTSLKKSLCILGPDIFSEGLSLQIADFDVWTPRILMDDTPVSFFRKRDDTPIQWRSYQFKIRLIPCCGLWKDGLEVQSSFMIQKITAEKPWQVMAETDLTRFLKAGPWKWRKWCVVWIPSGGRCILYHDMMFSG